MSKKWKLMHSGHFDGSASVEVLVCWLGVNRWKAGKIKWTGSKFSLLLLTFPLFYCEMQICRDCVLTTFFFFFCIRETELRNDTLLEYIAASSNNTEHCKIKNKLGCIELKLTQSLLVLFEPASNIYSRVPLVGLHTPRGSLTLHSQLCDCVCELTRTLHSMASAGHR